MLFPPPLPLFTTVNTPTILLTGLNARKLVIDFSFKVCRKDYNWLIRIGISSYHNIYKNKLFPSLPGWKQILIIYGGRYVLSMKWSLTPSNLSEDNIYNLKFTFENSENVRYLIHKAALYLSDLQKNGLIKEIEQSLENRLGLLNLVRT